MKDLQDLTISMDYIDHVRLAKYRQSCVIQQPDVSGNYMNSQNYHFFYAPYSADSRILDTLR